MTLQEIRTMLERRRGQKAQVVKSISSTKKKILEAKKQMQLYEKAREVVKFVALETQRQLQFYISDITTLALDAVFSEDPYNLEVEFVERRNKTECDIYFTRDGNKVDPMEASGFGAVDTAAFALRIASWSLQIPRSRKTLILDEPFNGLDMETVQKVKLLLPQMKATKTILITSHILESLTNICDSISYLNAGVIQFTKDKKDFASLEPEIFAVHHEKINDQIRALVGGQ